MVKLTDSEYFRHMNDLCCQLLLSVRAAQRCETGDQGGILAYSLISTCASTIQSAAEKRRQTLALSQYDRFIGDNPWEVLDMDVRLEILAHRTIFDEA